MSDDWQVVEEALNTRPVFNTQPHLEALAALARLREREAQLRQELKWDTEKFSEAKAKMHAAEACVKELGNELAAERSKDGGTFDQWARLQVAEARVAELQQQVERLEEALRFALPVLQAYSIHADEEGAQTAASQMHEAHEVARRALAHEEEPVHPYYAARVAAGLPTTACPRCGKTDGYHASNCPLVAHEEEKR